MEPKCFFRWVFWKWLNIPTVRRRISSLADIIIITFSYIKQYVTLVFFFFFFCWFLLTESVRRLLYTVPGNASVLNIVALMIREQNKSNLFRSLPRNGRTTYHKCCRDTRPNGICRLGARMAAKIAFATYRRRPSAVFGAPDPRARVP